MKNEQKTIENSISQEIQGNMMQNMHKTTVAALPSTTNTSDVMIVDPKIVSQDWVDAFNALNDRKVGKVLFLIKDSPPIGDVVDIEAMPGGYLMLFTMKTVKGPKYKIIKTSDIGSLVSE